MDPKQITKQVENNEVFLLDVREDSEWNTGHIPDAKHIPLGNINKETVSGLPKDIPIYIYCRSGGRAGVAESYLQDLGYSNAENIGGILEWQAMGGKLAV